MQKCAELSKLCEQDIFFVIFDRKKQKYCEFRSSMDFDIDIVKALLSNEVS